ncbi:uncharacterized protein LOC133525582 [Cydia pomonella]|uniref:uncharacterized protein LOC133525582 n=1 Tax=Cydia pomonella TaxID=82600 RepID=UPI002ADE8FBC|nr:uncharacterized protein LOC133525582 [Cydia pomonella]
MGVVAYKNEIKNLFLIINAYLALSIGLFPVSLGLAMVVTNEREPEIILEFIVVGTFTLGVTALGHFGAILDKHTSLKIYAAAVGLASFIELVVMVKLLPRTLEVLVFGMFHAILTLSALLLAMALRRAHKQLYPRIPMNVVAAPSAPTLSMLPTLPTLPTIV